MSDKQFTVEYRQLDFFGCPGYRVGSDGSVWSSWIGGSNPPRRGEWKLLKQRPNKDGHMVVFLSPRKSGTIFVHRLVLEAFVGPRPEGMVARHFPDRNPANNRVENLSWSTQLVNQRDRVIHGTHCRGAKCYAAKLTEKQVRDIRYEYATTGISQRALAKKYGISQGPLNNLLAHKSWKDV